MSEAMKRLAPQREIESFAAFYDLYERHPCGTRSNPDLGKFRVAAGSTSLDPRASLLHAGSEGASDATSRGAMVRCPRL